MFTLGLLKTAWCKQHRQTCTLLRSESGTWVRCVRVTEWVIKFPCNVVNTMLTPSVKLAFLTWLSLIRFRHSSIGRTLLKYYTFVIQAFLSYVYNLRLRHHLKLSGQHLAEYSTEQISGDFFSEFAWVDVYYSKKRRTASVWLQLRKQALELTFLQCHVVFLFTKSRLRAHCMLCTVRAHHRQCCCVY